MMQLTRESNGLDLDRVNISVSHCGVKYTLQKYDDDVTLGELVDAVERFSKQPPGMAIGMYVDDD